MNLNIIWCFIFLVIVFNLILNLVDPLKYSESINCLKLPCRNFELGNQILSFLFDICAIIVLSNMIGFKSTSAIFVILLFLVFVVYMSWYTSKPVVKDKTMNPPPELFLRKNIRIVLQSMVLLFDLIIFALLFMVRTGIDSKYKNDWKYLDILDNDKGYGFWNLINTRFGGNVGGNKFNFYCGWALLLGIGQNIYNLVTEIKFIPANYNLPNSWGI